MAIPSISGIYRIRNLLDGKVYIGSAINFRTRWNSHRCLLRQGKHFCEHLQAAWNKHGAHAFVYEVIEACENDRLIEREQHWLDAVKSYNRSFGYNSRPKAENQLGLHHSEETIRKISIAKMGAPSWNKGVPMTATAKEKMRAKKIGLKHTLETKAKMSAVRTGRRHSAEAKAKMSAIAKAKGRRLSDAALRKSVEARKGKPHPMLGRKHSLETREKISAAHKGKPLTEAQLAHLKRMTEMKKGMPDPRKGKPQTSAHRQAVSAAVKAWWAKRKATDPLPII
jgi:group I intron endonuclease